eukprot:Protomagalhaensia_sp_Gyna_25__1944@NODE_2035_length_1335_cov_382_981481_g1680_i0_p2_GENE_NODE_2035_length_1335_cov_382_981481_g1680_i0NODE_2035_length_1335_cov_382_981481_g1680_i0_p2_ORF_typecomplete_len163_score28_42Peptidase_U4/PF03419_13/0_084DUF3054/PF11255_8/0_17_NODE_2035_length_1335_cov_382_981481_g1680_i0165653
MDLPEFFRWAGKWCGLLGSGLTLLLGCLHIFLIGASIEWPQHRPITDDVQASTWRAPMFSLVPDILLETWTPFVVGLLGILAHFRDHRRLHFITESFVNYFVFNMFEGLFATIAYNGGIGILFSIVVWLAAFFSLCALIIDDGSASLDLNFKRPGKPQPSQP